MTSIAFQQAVAINRAAGRIIGCLTFTLLMAIGAYIRIPLFFTPIPLTFQTFFVLLSGAVLGRRWGALSQILYVSVGALGLPVFQGYGCGISHIFGPTGGYLFGFICASYLIGYFTEKSGAAERSLSIFPAMIVGLIAVYLCGVTWLRLFLGANLRASLMMGLCPFLPGEVLKVIAASYIYIGLRKKI